MPDLTVLPDGLRARPIRPGDVGAIAALLAEAEAVDDTGEHEDAEDLTTWLVNDRVDLAADTRAVETADGEVVGWACAVDLGTHREAYAVHLEGRVHPAWRGRGLGRALLDWQVSRARELHRTRLPAMPSRFGIQVSPAQRSLARLLTRAGFAPVQHYVQMQRLLTGSPSPRPIEGVEPVAYDWARDDEVRRTHNRCFAEHAGLAERDSYAWRTWFTGQRAFRPDLARLVLGRDGEIVGYVLVYEHPADTAATGVREAYLGQIGVLPEWRGRGVALAAVGAALHAAAADGLDRAALQVDSDNTTGALRLYERLGFTEVRRDTVWALRLPPVG